MQTHKIADHSGMSQVITEYFCPESIGSLQEYLINHPQIKIRIGGGLTGVCGGAVPEKTEHFIDLKKLNALKWLDKKTGLLEAESGVTMQQIQVFAEEENLFFPQMSGMPLATIGGMVACNGGGPYSLKYGKMENAVLAMDILLPNGVFWHTGSLVKKDSAGMNFSKLFIGSEGTLGIITKVIIRCIPITTFNYYRIAFDDFEKMLSVVPVLLQQDPYLIEAAEKNALRFSSSADEHVIWIATSKPFLKTMPLECRITEQDKNILSERFQIGHGIQTYKPFLDLDVSFPVYLADQAILELKRHLTDRKLEHVFFGHAGDGNWHIHVFFDDETQKWEQTWEAFDDIISSFSGSISGEHGIGRIHRKRFQRQTDAYSIEMYKTIKSVTDPLHQLPSLL